MDWYVKNHSNKIGFAGRVKRLLKMFKSPSDAWLAARICAWAVSLPFLKRTISLRILARWMWIEKKMTPSLSYEQKISTIVRWLYTFVFPQGACVERSLILYRYLSPIQKDARLVTGLRKSDGIWKGHAWIVLNGRPYEEAQPAVEDFKPIMVFGPEGKSLQP